MRYNMQTTHAKTFSKSWWYFAWDKKLLITQLNFKLCNPYIKDIRRAKSMEYKKAEEILPKELLREIQNYIQGATLYIPKETHHEWGEKSGIKDKLHKRNQLIKEKFQQGNSIQSLANDFYLSEETIKKIVYKK